MTDEKLRAGPATAELCPRVELPPRLRKPRLNTLEASEYLLLQHGVKCAPATMSKLRSVGGGAEFQKFGATPVYQKEALDRWALDRLGSPRRSTSEAAQ